MTGTRGRWPHGRSRDGGADEIPLPGPGRLWLCGKHYIGPDPEHAMRRTGTSYVVCLTERHELAERYPHYVDWLDRSVPDRAAWLPIPDLSAPSPQAATDLVDGLVARLGAGEALLVHCGAGIGRAGTIAVAVLVRLGVPLDAALGTVAHARPSAGPEAGEQRALLERLTSRPAG